jgi:hypothetical protein
MAKGSNPLGLGFKVKDWFFDRKQVTRRLDPVKKRFLSKFGSFVRTRARTLLNKPGGAGNRVSMAGEPPRKHNGRLRKNVFFVYDRAKESVVIGPIRLSGVQGGGTAPEMLEGGGSILANEIEQSGGGRDSAGKFLKTNTKVGKKVHRRIAARPYMGPAFASEKANISSIWRQSGGF